MDKNKNPFKNSLATNTFQHKYSAIEGETWWERCLAIVEDVCGTRWGETHPLLSKEERYQLALYIYELKFLPGGRYIRYAGRPAKFFNNCYLLRVEEDTREEWSSLAKRAMSCLMTGGGIGVDYSIIRPAGRVLRRTGGIASGPIPLMHSINEIGRNVMQGGSRRSAIYGSLNWQHEDIPEFLRAKNWDNMEINGTNVGDLKRADFNFPAPLDMTNISLNYDDSWLEMENRHENEVFLENCRQALATGEPGFSFNFGDKENETLRNACTEITSEDDSDVCNLGSINMGAIDSLDDFRDCVNLASKFLVCGTLRAELPYDKVYEVRELNRRLGLGLMGMHEWLLKRGYPYEVVPELHAWLGVYKEESERAANEHCDRFFLNHPIAYRAIAPTGTIGILAGTTTGIEPLFACAYKRRYLIEGAKWKYEIVVDSVAKQLIEEHGLDPDNVDTAKSLQTLEGIERRIRFQADVQDYVDMGISSTINLPSSESTTEGAVHGRTVEAFSEILSRYAPRLRGFTCYPDGARGGQPITPIPYDEAVGHEGTVYEEANDACKGGICGV